eukprot:XP_011431172.2 PREDICTED: uncharacterized protein LOC105330928 [Crassostrea gigas]
MEFQWIIFEVFVILLTHFSKEVLSFDGYNVAQSSISLTQNGPANALDNNNRSCAVTNYGKGNYWRIQFNQTLMVDSVELRLKGGNYTIEVGNSLKKVSDRHVCASEHLPFFPSKYTVNVSCKPAVRGDIIAVNRVDSGSLTLCDFKLRVCGLSTDGEPCPMCTVDSTCRHCDQSHYGASCEHKCSPGCVPGSCDELTGECNCTTGFTGTHCQFLGEPCLL